MGLVGGGKGKGVRGGKMKPVGTFGRRYDVTVHAVMHREPISHHVTVLMFLLFQAKMIFAGNKARVGPVMFVSNLAACEWYSLNSSEYFEANNTRRWENILSIRYCLCDTCA